MKKTLLLLALLGTVASAQTAARPATFTLQPFERAVLDLLTEVRTKGTLQGSASIRNGTCLADFDRLGPRAPLVSNPVLSLASRKHAQYITEEWKLRGVAPDYEQRNRNNTHFYGVTVQSRTDRAGRELGVAAPENSHMYIRTGPVLPADFVRSLLEDRLSCLQLTALRAGLPAYHVGAGYNSGFASTPEISHPNPWGFWVLILSAR